MSSTYHLAEINIGRTVAPMDDPAMEGFVSQLDTINALAEASPGFVWRLKTDEGDATSIVAYDDPRIIVNMSVWESLQTLRAYVYTTNHADVLRDRKKWFEKLDSPHFVMWWIPAGHIPTVQEAKDRLAFLAEHGETAHAFTFRTQFQPPNAASA